MNRPRANSGTSLIGRVITGGQTGADQGGWRAAKAAGLPTGGYMTEDFWTEGGVRPEFAEEFGAEALKGVKGKAGLPVRTGLNVYDSDLVLIFGNIHSSGSRCTIRACSTHNRPWLHVDGKRPSEVAAWVLDRMPGQGTLMIAGNRETSSPGIAKRVESFLAVVFRKLQEV